VAEQPAIPIGLDIGSTTAKGVMVGPNGEIIAKHIRNTGASVSSVALDILQVLCDAAGVTREQCTITATGYGRASVDFASRNITEITCHSIGVHHLNPKIRLLIDVGGQDSKAIRIGSNGRPEDFQLNDKCSAGTGRFLEVMARVLEISLDELGPLALKSKHPSTITSTCTVFAESEVVGRIGSGNAPEDIAAGVHLAMAAKVSSLAKQVKIEPPIGVTGGVALNPAFRHYLSQKLGHELWMPEAPQFTGALGAALLSINP
jgi:predicted CoA-substrate-specific enzyme activase